MKTMTTMTAIFSVKVAIWLRQRLQNDMKIDLIFLFFLFGLKLAMSGASSV